MADEADTSTGTENQESTQDGGNANADAKFTQIDMDRAIASRLARERASWQKQLKAEVSKASEESISAWREEHGLDDDEKLTKLLGSDNTKVELTKLKGKLTKAENARLALEEKLATKSSRLREALVNDVILREAAGKFIDPEEAVLLLKNELLIEDDDSVYHVGPNGEPSGKTIAEVVTELLEKKPHLAPPTGSRGAGSRVGEPGKGGNAEPKPGEKGYLAHRLGGG